MWTLFVLAYAVQQMLLLSQLADTDYKTSETIMEVGEQVAFTDYDDSANFLIGINNKSIDLFDNEYFSYKAYK